MWKAIPTWLLMRLCKPFLPATHPFCNKHFPLRYWHETQTPLCELFDLVFWGFGISAVIIIVRNWLV